MTPTACSAAPAEVPRTLGEVLERARASLGREPALTALGLLGTGVALVCLVGVAVYGPMVPPEGKMLDAAAFTFGVAVFTLTVALILPLAGFEKRSRRLLRWTFFAFAAYGFVIETVQAFRGLDPRVSAHFGPADQAAAIVFGLSAIAVTVAFLVLALGLFRRDLLQDRRPLRLGLRYGALAVLLSFAGGVLMIALEGRMVGEAGNLLPAHGLGVHGLQALPGVGLLLSWSAVGLRDLWIHAAGAGWLAATGAALAQALRGAPPAEATALPAVTVAGLVLWAGVAGHALLAWRRAGPGARSSFHQLSAKQ